jgi:hypothetical protein
MNRNIRGVPALTPRALSGILSGHPIWRPILQVIKLIEITLERGVRIQAVLADATQKFRHVLLARNLEYMYHSGQLTQFAIISCLDWRLRVFSTTPVLQ